MRREQSSLALNLFFVIFILASNVGMSVQVAFR